MTSFLAFCSCQPWFTFDLDWEVSEGPHHHKLIQIKRLPRSLQTYCVSGVTNPMFKEPLRKQIEVKGIGLGLEDNGIQGPVPLCHVEI